MTEPTPSSVGAGRSVGGRPRIGVFGGTFDPPHIGHLVTAIRVRHALGLDRMLLMVANVPWQKRSLRAVTPPADRLAMVQDAILGVEGLEASSIEIDRGGDTYTADTLAELRAESPDAELFLVLGADAAALLTTWERVDEVRSGATIVVVDRPGSRRSDLPAGFTFEHVEVPHLDVSSTEIRGLVADGAPIDFLVPPAVIARIRERQLYRDRA